MMRGAVAEARRAVDDEPVARRVRRRAAPVDRRRRPRGGTTRNSGRAAARAAASSPSTTPRHASGVHDEPPHDTVKPATWGASAAIAAAIAFRAASGSLTSAASSRARITRAGRVDAGEPRDRAGDVRCRPVDRRRRALSAPVALEPAIAPRSRRRSARPRRSRSRSAPARWSARRPGSRPQPSPMRDGKTRPATVTAQRRRLAACVRANRSGAGPAQTDPSAPMIASDRSRAVRGGSANSSGRRTVR